jgi:hypothetical protein
MNKVSIYDNFDRLPASYKEVFDNATTSSVFFSLPWFEHLSKTVFAGEAPNLIYGVESLTDGTPQLALPLWKLGKGRGTVLHGPSILTSAANFYTPLYSPIIRQPHVGLKEKLSLLAHALTNAAPHWDILRLSPMDPDSDIFDHLLMGFRQAGMPADSYFCFGNWYLEVSNRSYREYAESLPARLVNTLKRKSKQAEKASRLRIEIIAGDTGLTEGITAYEAVYNSSWKEPEVHPAFMPGLIRLCARNGWLRLGIAYIDEQPAAAQVWIVNNGVASIFKLAYDQRFSKLSIGSLLTARLMEHVIDVDRVREVDYLTGDDAYKQDWMSARRERRGIVVFNPRKLHGAFAALRHFGARRLKQGFRYLSRPGTAAPSDSTSI